MNYSTPKTFSNGFHSLDAAANQGYTRCGRADTASGELVVGKSGESPEAFKEELQRGFALISQRPEAGARAASVKLKGVRRIHLSRIRYFLYYRIHDRKVEILALWHSSRSKRPVLKDPPNQPL